MSQDRITPGSTTLAAEDFSVGGVFESPRLRTTLLEHSADAFRTEVEAGPDANGGPLHRHMHQQERFLVSEGTLRVRLGLRGSRLVGPGEDVVVAPGRPHTFSVVGDSAHFVAEFTPSLRVADYFLELFNLEEPELRAMARLAQKYPDEHFYLPVVPPAVQRLLLWPLAVRNQAT